MKKIVSIILLLTLCLGLFAGCNNTPAETTSDLELAKKQVFNLYKPGSKDEVPAKSNDFEVVTSVLVGGVAFSVEWAVEVTSGAADAVKIVDGSSSAYKKVELPKKPETAVEFTLTATVKDAEGKSETLSFKYIVPAVAAPSAEPIVLYFGKDGKYITGSHYFYESKSKWELNLSENKADAIAMVMVDNGDDTVSFVAGEYYLFCDATSVMFVKEQSDNTKFVLEAADANGGYFIKCAVANYGGKPQYLEVYSGYLTCYGMGTDTSIYTFTMEKAEGANGTISGLENTTPETPTEPTDPVEPSDAKLPPVTNPAEGKTYKFGMYQVTNGHVVYIAGGIDQDRYLITTPNWEEALDVTIEKSGDGIKIATTIDGKKVYVTFGVNDAGKNALSYTAEGTVLKFNADLHIWYTTLGADEVYIGSYSTFDTMSISKNSYITAENAGVSQFPAGFFETKPEGGETPDEPETPTTPPTTPPTEPEQGNDAVLTNGCKVVIYNPAHNKALSSLPSSDNSFYQKGVDITVSGSTVSGYANTEIWTVIINADGTYSFEQGGQKLGMQDSYSSMSLGAVNDKWELVLVSDGLYLIKNVVRGNCIEWYSSKNNWSTYTGTGDLFNLSFYIVG